jgi:hypothetical protein
MKKLEINDEHEKHNDLKTMNGEDELYIENVKLMQVITV